MGMADQVAVLDMNRVKVVQGQPGDICDCGVLFNNEAIIAAVELKGGQNVGVAKLVKQIQGGLNALAKVVDRQHVSFFYPILMYRTRNAFDLRRALERHKVTFRNMSPRPIIPSRCGTRLSAILDDERRKRRRRSR